MSVLINGMEMPTNCADCPLNYDQMACAVTWTRWWSDSMMIMNFDSDKERMPNCPLIEVPTPHGRLIDADKLANETFYGATSAPYITYRKFVNAPTVIEAEGSET